MLSDHPDKGGSHNSEDGPAWRDQNVVLVQSFLSGESKQILMNGKAEFPDFDASSEMTLPCPVHASVMPSEINLSRSYEVHSDSGFNCSIEASEIVRIAGEAPNLHECIVITLQPNSSTPGTVSHGSFDLLLIKSNFF